jgi:uncharacterized membrane protein YdjX (TVP38/TMEM64 family)
MKNTAKIFLLILIITFVVVFISYDLSNYFTLGFLKENKNVLSVYYQHNQFKTLSIYFGLYVLVAALSLPGGATILTLAGGAIFGFITGLITISFASTIGATLSFLVSRFLLRDIIEKKIGNKIKAINDGIEKEGFFYLFSLRLIPIFPFFLINIAMGLTKINTVIFYITSQLGMFLGTALYVNAGVQLAKINTLSDIASPTFLLSFSLLGIFPLIAKKLINSWRTKND